MAGLAMKATCSSTVLITLASALVLGGCGQSAGGRALHADGVPLVPGARVVAQARSCDRGANAYCSLQMVVVATGYASSAALLAGERARLRASGWTSTAGDASHERSADSPGHRLRLSYAPAADDLESWDLGYIRRRPPIARALAQTMFQGPALSLMLLTGSS